MKVRETVPGLLSILALLGLLLTPLARLAIAMPTDMSDMPMDMPCCQSDSLSPDCTEDCPFIALCMTGSVLNLPAIAGLLMPFELANLIPPNFNTNFSSRNHDPPLRPPQA